MWSLAHKWRSVCSLILSCLPVLPCVPCQSLQEQCYVTAICHGDLPGRGDLQAERHHSHGCGIRASLYGAGTRAGSQCASDARDANSWGLEQHQLQHETQMEFGFGGANVEICRRFSKPETSCCEWKDVASISSRLQEET